MPPVSDEAVASIKEAIGTGPGEEGVLREISSAIKEKIAGQK